MYMRKLFCLIIVLFSPYLSYAMDEGSSPSRGVKRTREEASESTLVQEIRNGIFNFDPVAIFRLLSADVASELSSDQRDGLYKEADKTQDHIEYMREIGNKVVVRATDPAVKEKFSYDTEYKNAKKIRCNLYAFKFLKKLRFPQALFNPRPYYTADPRPSLATVLEALIMNEQEKVSVCCFHITLYNVVDSLVRQKNEGATIEVVTNQTQGATPPLQAITHLIDSNIVVLSPKTRVYEVNHHKFFIFKRNMLDKNLVWVGSYNATGHSNENSWEDVVILDDAEVIQCYLDRFEEIKAASQKITRDELQRDSNKSTPWSLANNNVPNELR